MAQERNKKNHIIHTLTATLFLWILIVPITYAEDTVEEKVGELQELQQKEVKYRDIIEVKTQEATAIQSQVASLETQSKEIEKNIINTQQEVDKVSEEISATERKITEKEAAIASQKTILAKILRSKYDRSIDSATLTQFFKASSSTLFSTTDNITRTSVGIGDIVKLIATERETLTRDKKNLDDTKKDITNVKSTLQQQNIQLEVTKDQKELLAIETNAEKAKYTKRLDNVLEEQLEIQSEIDSLGTTRIGTFDLSDLPDKSNAEFKRPVKAPYQITQNYGQTDFSYNYGSGKHNGIDYATRGSTDIMATANGKVKATGNMGRYGYGKWIAIDHGNGLISLYGHLSKIDVSSGDSVKQGETIGQEGSTGFSTGTHLHFTLFATETFSIVQSSSVPGIYIPTGGTINPALYL